MLVVFGRILPSAIHSTIKAIFSIKQDIIIETYIYYFCLNKITVVFIYVSTCLTAYVAVF